MRKSYKQAREAGGAQNVGWVHDGNRMLLQFALTNYRSFRDRKELKLRRPTVEVVKEFPEPGVAPAIAIFGPNSSGKTNLLRGLRDMFSMIRSSASEAEAGLPYTPFMLGDHDGQPTTFEVAVLLGGVRYEYGFTFDARRIQSEWLYSWPKNRQRLLFERNVDDEAWRFGEYLTGPNAQIARSTRDDALFFSTARLLNHEDLTDLHAQFARLIRHVSSEQLPSVLQSTTDSLARDPERLRQVTQLMTRAEFGIVDLKIEENQLGEEARETTRRLIQAIRPEATLEEIDSQMKRTMLSLVVAHSGSNGPVPLPFSWESVGTRNFFALLGPILDRLARGGVIVIDEIDTSLHPRLVSEVVRLFQSPDTNPKQAQLVLSTHDVTVMMNTGDYKVLRRDQIWFTEKDEHGVSNLFSLWDLHPRAGEVFSRRYLLGDYGAVPPIDYRDFAGLWQIEDGDSH
tara:strand:+ start:11687 stop:13054 length:1368 start_codon:yes stop_codon:yes gene_type:complete